MDVLLGSLLILLEGVVPGEGEVVDLVLGRGKQGSDPAEGAKVGLEVAQAGGEGALFGGFRELGAIFVQGLKVIFEVLGLALGVFLGDVQEERSAQVNGLGLLLGDAEHGEHQVGTHDIGRLDVGGGGRRGGGRQ